MFRDQKIRAGFGQQARLFGQQFAHEVGGPRPFALEELRARDRSATSASPAAASRATCTAF